MTFVPMHLSQFFLRGFEAAKYQWLAGRAVS